MLKRNEDHVQIPVLCSKSFRGELCSREKGGKEGLWRAAKLPPQTLHPTPLQDEFLCKPRTRLFACPPALW